MPRTAFDPKNQRVDPSQFPKLQLEKDEKARILCIEKEPMYEWTHELRQPKILNGKAVVVKKTRSNGETYEDYDMDYKGSPICFGDDGVLFDKGVDVANCPACLVSTEGDMLKAPQRRYAMHVIKYATQPGSSEIQNQFNAQLLIWRFNEKKYYKLIELASEHNTSLLNRDIILGPCVSKMYQSFEINIAGKAEWLANEERKTFVANLYRDNKVDDSALSAMCGRKVQRAFLEDDLQAIKDAWAIINGTPVEAFDSPAADAPDFASASASLDAGLEDLVSSQTGLPTPVEDVVPAAEVEEPASKKPKEDSLGKPGSSGEVLEGFESLLDL
jgi:hypothetical protein